MREQCRSIVTEPATMSRRKRPAATGARILSQPAGALNKFVRAALATFALCAMFLRILAPTEAQPAAIQVDPRIVELIKTGCGTEHVAVRPTPEPSAPFHMPQKIVLLAQAEASPSPAPTGTTSPGPSVASPTPAPTPTASPLPNAPPGPAQLIPPTPSGSPFPTAPPPPSPSPVPNSSGPVYLVSPTGPPPTIEPAGGRTISAPRSSGPSQIAPTPVPSSVPTLAPFQMAVMFDRGEGWNREGQPADAIGNVHIFYSEGQLVGDRAHYDGDHTITVTGHTYLINRNQDSILYADSITFDTRTRRATLVNGHGESTEGVQRGKIHYTARELNALNTGVSHGEHASFTTCENPHGGYHIEARQLDVFPNSRLIARKAVVFLGPLAILYLPLLVIPLREYQDPRRPQSFLPLIGYSDLEGYYVKMRIGFNPSDTYYGYYRFDFMTRRGLGLGYSAFFGTNNQRRFATFDGYTINDRLAGGRQSNATLNETEYFSNRLKGTFSFQYQGDYGPGITLPVQWNINAVLARTGVGTNEQLTFSRTTQGALSDNYNLGFLDSVNISPQMSERINITYGKFDSGGISSENLHLESDTHWSTKAADYDATYDKTDSNTSGLALQRLPEITVNPHINFHGFRFPFQANLTLGEYAEPSNAFSTSRAELHFTEPVTLKLGKSDFNATEDIRQDYYGTGDAKATESQNMQLTTPLGNHIVNAIIYSENHPIGPADVPFQTLDRLSGGSHNAQETLRIFNGDVYLLQIGASTFFNRQAQALTYQFTTRPSLRSYLLLGGSYVPGPGNGFFSTNVQGITGLGHDTTLQFSTNVDWKNKGRLVNKTMYLSKIIANCYRTDLSYNQDLKAWNFAISILAFPNQAIGGQIGTFNPTAIVPGGLNY